MKLILASLGLIGLLTADADAQYQRQTMPYGAGAMPYGNAPPAYMPPPYVPPAPPATSPDYYVVVPRGPAMQVIPGPSSGYQVNPCVYRLGGC